MDNIYAVRDQCIFGIQIVIIAAAIATGFVFINKVKLALTPTELRKWINCPSGGECRTWQGSFSLL
jgi:hypothetical protein